MKASGVDKNLNNEKNILSVFSISISQQTSEEVRTNAVPKNNREDVAIPHNPPIINRLSIFVFLNLDTTTPTTTEEITM